MTRMLRCDKHRDRQLGTVFPIFYREGEYCAECGPAPDMEDSLWWKADVYDGREVSFEDMKLFFKNNFTFAPGVVYSEDVDYLYGFGAAPTPYYSLHMYYGGILQHSKNCVDADALFRSRWVFAREMVLLYLLR